MGQSLALQHLDSKISELLLRFYPHLLYPCCLPVATMLLLRGDLHLLIIPTIISHYPHPPCLELKASKSLQKSNNPLLFYVFTFEWVFFYCKSLIFYIIVCHFLLLVTTHSTFPYSTYCEHRMSCL